MSAVLEKRPAKGARHRVQRTKERARYDRDTLHAILDAGFVAHVGFTQGAQPFVIPMLYARQGERVLLHGSVASRFMGALGEGVPCCVSVTHLDGMVLARSHFHHSMNYRSAVLFGQARVLDDLAEKLAALAHFVDVMVPGRAALTRAPDAKELAATTVLAFELQDASAKIRRGGTKDHPDDLALPVWAGVIPMALAPGTPEPAGDMRMPAALVDPFTTHPAFTPPS